MLAVKRLWSVALIIGLVAAPSAFAQSEASSQGSARQAESGLRPPTFGAVAPPPAKIRAHEPAEPAVRPARPGRSNSASNGGFNSGFDSGFDDSPSFDRMRPGAGDTAMPRPGADAFRATPDTYAPAWGQRPSAEAETSGRQSSHTDRRGRSGRRGILFGAPVYAVPYGPYAYGPYAPGDRPGSAAAEAPAEGVVARGFLRLLVEPRGAAVVIDGVYEGTADDFGGAGERTIPAGLHRVRLEADGYEPVVFDVRVPDNDTITLRRALERRVEARAVPVTPTPSATPGSPIAKTTIYLIPRCYLGDTRPRPEQLPAGCRLADLQTLP